jgi:drug/metabolite transporter (DMT)-like permease
MTPLGLLIPAVCIAAAFGVQGLRFLLWGYAHRRWPLSMTYPMTAVFFPLLIALAALYGEQVSPHQWLGGLCITAGVAWITFKGVE